MLLTDLPQQRLSTTANSADFLRVMMFAVCQPQDAAPNYFFALPAEAIIRVAPAPPNLGNFNQGITMLNIGQEMVTVVDLCYRVLPERPATSVDRQFLIFVQTTMGETCAIPTANFPLLLDMPISTVRPIPAAYRQVNDMNFASHMAILDSPSETLSAGDPGKAPLQVFLIGMNYLIAEKLMSVTTERKPLELMAGLN
jgi:hypothetical protein